MTITWKPKRQFKAGKFTILLKERKASFVSARSHSPWQALVVCQAKRPSVLKGIPFCSSWYKDMSWGSSKMTLEAPRISKLFWGKACASANMARCAVETSTEEKKVKQLSVCSRTVVSWASCKSMETTLSECPKSPSLPLPPCYLFEFRSSTFFGGKTKNHNPSFAACVALLEICSTSHFNHSGISTLAWWASICWAS